jgi:hypothetical protein
MRVPYEGAVERAARAAERRTVCAAIALLALVCCVSMWVPATANAADSSVIELIGGTAARTINVSPKASLAGSRAVLSGEVQLTLRNTTTTTVDAEVLLASESLPGPTVLQHMALSPGALRQVSMTVTLPPDHEPDALNGTLVLDAKALHATSSQQLLIPVTAAVAPIGDVRFAPDPAVVQVTRWCLELLPCNTTDVGSVQLYGSGVGSLVAEYEMLGETRLSTKLRAGSNSVDVELFDLQLNPERPGTATAHLRLGAKPTAGEYMGSIALSPLLPHSPALSISVRSRFMFIWVVLPIFFGVLLAGYFYQQLGLSRRKRLLREMMRHTINDEYCPLASKNKGDGVLGHDTLIWDPKVPCELEDNPDWSYYTELKKPADIYTAIYWARNDADLNEAEAVAVALVRAIKSWLLVLTEVLVLWELIKQARGMQAQWDNLKTGWDSRLLISKARHPPRDRKSCDELLEKICQQAEWHRAMAEAWDLRSKLIALPGQPAQDAAAVDLPKVAAEAQPILDRTQEEQDELEQSLERLYAQLADILERVNANPATPTIEVAPIGDGTLEVESQRLRHELVSLASPTPLAMASISGAYALAGLSGTSSASAAGEAEGAVPIKPTRARRPPAPPTSSRAFGLVRRLRLLDLLMSVLILLATSVIYAATVYSPTWGSPADWGTAFAAGFSGQVVIKWALLPIYRSLRLRAPTGEAQPAATAAAT